MTQYEFIQELEQALRGQVSPQVVEYNVNYYREYIREQLASGKTKEEVFALLGSPQIIAKTIISSEEAKGNTYEEKEDDEPRRFEDYVQLVLHGEWYYKVIVVAVILLVLYVLFSVVFTIVKFLFWPVVILAVLCAIWEYFKKR